MRLFLALGCALLLQSQALAAPEITWSQADYDPAPLVDRSLEPADLIVPLPCGGAIALMRIDTEARADDPLDDQRFRMGSPDIARAPYQYIRHGYIRGAFPDETHNTTHYYLGRYEVTQAQFEAVTAWAEDRACPELDPDTSGMPANDFSWFDAQVFASRLSEWARREVPDLMPRGEGDMGFFRLPSEAEWEFAARGGTVVDKATFNAPRFPMDKPIRYYAWHEGSNSARGEIQWIGQQLPNPLGLHDIYGNAEEMVFEMFTLNRGGRPHGQFGGFVTRGGSFRSKPREMSSAARTEYPFYLVGEAAPVVFPKIGMRVALGNFVLSSNSVMDAVEDSWDSQLNPADKEDPRALLKEMIDEEVDISRKADLENLQSDQEAMRTDLEGLQENIETLRTDRERLRSDLESLQGALINSMRESEEATALALQRAIFSGGTLLMAMTELNVRRDALLDGREEMIAAIDAEKQILEQRIQEGAGEGELTIIRDGIADTEVFLQGNDRRLAKFEREIDIYETHFVATVDAVYESSTPETLQRETDILLGEQDRIDHLELVLPIKRFSEVVSAYRANPTIGRPELLELALQ